MSAGYNDPGFGLPDSGGSFIGLGRMTAACNIPNEIQPAIPPDGLFGPDAFIPSWGFPGYNRLPDIAHPMPFPIPIDGPYSAGGGNLPGTRPSSKMPGFGMTAYSYDETVGGLRDSINRNLRRLASKYASPVTMIVVPPAPTVGVTSEEPADLPSESAEESTSDSGGGLLGFLKRTANAAWSAVKTAYNAVSGVVGTIKREIEHGMQTVFYKAMTQKTWADSWNDTKWSSVDEGLEKTPFIRGCRITEGVLWLILGALEGLKAGGVTGPTLSRGKLNAPPGVPRWTTWEEYPKVNIGGREYAKIGKYYYPEKVVRNMQPRALGRYAPVSHEPRGVPPMAVEEAIKHGERTYHGVSSYGKHRWTYRTGNLEIGVEEGNIIVHVQPI